MGMLGWLKDRMPVFFTGYNIGQGEAYRGARITKLDNDWQPTNVSGDQAVHESWELLTGRVRDLVRNDPILTKALSSLVTLTIGSGIHCFSVAEDAEGNEIEDYANESDTWFERWAEEEADALGEKTFQEMQRIAFQDLVECGNSIWLRVQNRQLNRSVPLAYQLIEWEQLSRERDRPSFRGQNRISNGIEYDAMGRKVAYWIYDAHPFDYSVGGTSLGETRVPASRIIHDYLPSRISSTQGISWFAPIVMTSRDIDKYLANELTSQAISALLTLVVKRAQQSGEGGNPLGLDDTDADTGLKKVRMGYPYIAEVGPDDDVKAVHKERPNASDAAWIDFLLQMQAMGSRISVNRLLGNASKTNLAAIKASNIDDERLVDPLQNHESAKVIKPIRKEHARQAVGLGLYQSVSPALFRQQRFRYQSYLCIPAGSPDVLVKEEGEASIDRMRSGRSTFAYECARLGFHWKRNIRMMARINRFAKDAGVVLDWTKGQGAAPGSSSAAAGNGDRDEEMAEAESDE